MRLFGWLYTDNGVQEYDIEYPVNTAEDALHFADCSTLQAAAQPETTIKGAEINVQDDDGNIHSLNCFFDIDPNQ